VIVRQVLSPIVARIDASTVKVSVLRSPSLVVRVGVQGPAGPAGAGGTGGLNILAIQATNVESFMIRAGQPVQLVPGSGCKLAIAADRLNTATGLVMADAFPGAPTSILLLGLLTLSDWTAATGGGALLVDGGRYFLSQGAPGVITTVPPSGAGQISQYIAKAISTTEIFVQIARPIGL
jgi:hypothetical protein